MSGFSLRCFEKTAVYGYGANNIVISIITSWMSKGSAD